MQSKTEWRHSAKNELGQYAPVGSLAQQPSTILTENRSNSACDGFHQLVEPVAHNFHDELSDH